MEGLNGDVAEEGVWGVWGDVRVGDGCWGRDMEREEGAVVIEEREGRL